MKEYIERFLKENFGGLEFNEEKHEYKLNGESLICVSDFTKQWDVSDFNEIARLYARAHGKTKDYWLGEWKKKSDVSCEEGTFVHAIAESITRLNFGQDKEDCPSVCQSLIVDGKIGSIPSSIKPEVYNKCKAAKKFLNELADGLVPVAVENRIYTTGYKYNYAGTFDLLVYDKNRDGYIIYDYKTNESLVSNPQYLNFLKYPFVELTEDGIGHYTIQQSCYQIPLEDAGLKILDRKLVWLKSDGNYKIIPLKDKTDKIRKILNGLL